MKFFPVFTFLLLLVSTFSYSQKTDPLPSDIPGDTIEGTSTDTSIIYIIKKAPITIREKVEVQRTRIQMPKYLYMSFSAGPLWYSAREKAHSSYQDYVKTIRAQTRSLSSYALEWRVWKLKGKTLTGFSFLGSRLYQEFNYTDLNGASHRLINNFNYGSIALRVGHWIRKDKKISFIAQGGLAMDHFISAKGFTLNKLEFQYLERINRVMAYRDYNASLTGGFSTLLAVQNSFLEIEPYFTIAPFSATTKVEVYSLKRYFIGIRLAYTNRLF